MTMKQTGAVSDAEAERQTQAVCDAGKSETPITDALSTDPAIERRDVPARVWREMAALEKEIEQLRSALDELAVEFKDLARSELETRGNPQPEQGFDAYLKARALLSTTSTAGRAGK